MPDKSSLGDRMKLYEKQYSGQRLLSLIPVIARMDGRAFHSFCADLKRPYDERLSVLMIETTKYLVEETDANIGYTQSDEISLVWYKKDIDSMIFFDSKLLKMTSVLASLTTAFFNKNLARFMPEKTDKIPVFDARVWNVPTEWEATNYLIWREKDATRNSITMAAQSVYSHKELDRKSASDKHEMLHQKGINWNNYPNYFKRGSYVQRKAINRTLTLGELEKIPEKQRAALKDKLVTRHKIESLELPPLATIANREEVVFEGKEAVLKLDVNT